MAVTDYSTTAGSNTSISGINIAEGCSPANLNNAIRQMMADVRTFYNSADGALANKDTIDSADLLGSNVVTTAKILDDNVTLAKIATLTANRLVGTDGSGNPAEVTVSGATLSGGTLTVTGGNALGIGGTLKAGVYSEGQLAGSAPAQAFSSNTLYATPFVVGATQTFDRIAINITTSDAGDARLGIYNNTGGEPSSLVLDCGTVSTSTTGLKEITISQQLNAGLYFMAVVFQAAPSAARVNDNSLGSALIGTATTPYMTADAHGFTVSHSYGALPANYGTAVRTLNIPKFALRAA